MKKIFTLAAAMLMTIGMFAADKTYLLNEATLTSGDNDVYEWAFSEVKCKNFTYHYVEVPAATAGSISWQCTSSNTGRFIYLYTMENEALVKQTDRKLVMNTTFAAVGELAYTAEDIVVVNNANYLVFGTGDDFKAKGIRLTVTESSVAPATTPVTTVTVSGPTEVFVGQEISLKATFDVAPDTIWWTDKFGTSLNCDKATLKFTPDAEGSYTFVAWAQNQYNTQPAASEIHTVGATVKPAAVACANIIPASSGTAPTEVGTEIDLDINSEGGKFIVAGMKTAGESFVYNALGLGFMKGGADSIRVEFNNYIAEGSVITIKMAAGGTTERGLKLQTVTKSTLLDAKWTPAASGEEKEFEYTVPAGSPLIGDYRILLARNNSVYLQSVSMGDCGEARDIPADTDPVLKASKASVDMNLTAANPSPSATVTFTGKNLAAGTYNLTIPEVAGLTVTPTSVTVGEDGKLSAEVTIAYTSDVDVAAASANIVLTIGELSATVAVNYSAVLAKNYISASVNIEGLVMANGTGYDIAAAFDAAHIDYASLNALDTLNDSKGAARNEAYLGLKMKTSGAYIAGWLQAGHTIRVKFGNVGASVKVLAGGATQTFTKEQLATPLEYTATADDYVKIETTSSSTVVIKQIMIDEPIANVLFPITYNIGEGGTVTGWTVALPGEEVVMNITSNEGYALHNIIYNGTAMVQPAPGAPISFIMPAEDVTVEAVFGNIATGIENADAAVKAVKVVRNGQLFIEKNGVLYNAQGAVVK